MGAGRADDPASQARRPSARGECSRLCRIATALCSSSIGAHAASSPSSSLSSLMPGTRGRRPRPPSPRPAPGIVQRNELHRFVVLPKRWIVERTLAWISHSRRLARDFERSRAIRRGVYPSRNDPHHAPTIDRPNFLLLTPNFLDRLSEHFTIVPSILGSLWLSFCGESGRS
jgi:hypothetical protein